ncbi:lipid transfer vas [Olea europaea subsp. europaea]|uniref:Lipid transfer vas n=1 Tax=Olea europaea subsp. europaea TaxID=158383 RepID=A0A8S0RKJ2_OLEEU|nr:lipid transfer vas [Olea europaea subsp. europaea]
MTSSTKSAFTKAAFMVAVALLVITTRTAEGQADCAANLIPCAEYLNSTNPAPACCNAIREVVSTQLRCLCNLYNNPNLVPGINMTQALELPKHCNLSADTSRCKALSPTSSVVPTPGVIGGNDNNGAGKSISSVGVPSLFLLSSIVMFH